MPSFHFKLEGLEEFDDQLEEMMRRTENSKVIEDFVDSVEDYWKKAIQDQRLRLAPLASHYADWKERTGLDPRILIATGGYVDSVHTGKIEGENVWFMATTPEYDQIGMALEFGNGRSLLPRPHWRPTISWAESQWESIPAKFGASLLRGI